METTTKQNIVGREWLFSELRQWYEEGGQRAILTGPPGIGKSTVARTFASRIPDALYVDFSTLVSRDSWPVALSAEAQGQECSLLVLDAVDEAPASVWRTNRLEGEFPDVPKLFCFRPGMQAAGLVRPGTAQHLLFPHEPRHQEDINQYLSANGLGSLQGLIPTFREAEFLIQGGELGPAQLDQYYANLWRETTRPFSGNKRVLVEQVALLLADAPESLSLETISDFTGVPLVQIQEAMDELSRILTWVDGGVAIFSHGMCDFLTRQFSRDLGPVHGRIVSFFRETYPSWQEMHDPYGWRYLVLHCDRLARASRRKDFSILHWLNEGSFSQLKLERTGMLPSVLKDLRLSLLASLETEDLPRIVSFGCRLARLRKQEAVSTVHRLADAGHLAMARENAFLISGEGQRFLIWLLFATQTLEAGDLESTSALLDEAGNFPTLYLNDEEVELAANLLAVMLTHPDLGEQTHRIIYELLEMNGEAAKACLAFKSAGRMQLLPRELSLELLERGLEFARLIPPGKLQDMRIRELKVRLARLNPEMTEGTRPYPTTLVKAKDGAKAFQKLLKEVEKGDVPVATAAAALIPVADQEWALGAFLDLAKAVSRQSDPELVHHGLSGLIQSLTDSPLKELDDVLLDTLSVAIMGLESIEERSRFLARFAVMLTYKQRPMDAQQRISLSAANAFSVVDTASRAGTLLSLSHMVAATGALGRARDLAFHALELTSRADDLDRESRQLVRLRSSAAAANKSAEEIVRLGESLRFDNSPVEMEAKGRAMVTLASGLTRLGAVEEARVYRGKAIETTKAIDNPELRIHLLTDLAGALYSCDEKKEARKLVKEARADFDANEEKLGLMAAVALLRVYIIFENRTQTRKAFDRCVNYLEERKVQDWLGSNAFLELLHMAQHLGREKRLLPHIEAARSTQNLSDSERLGLLRCELQLGDFENADEQLYQLEDLSARCQGGVDMALALLPYHDEAAIQHLAEVPLESARCEGIRRLAMLNSAEIRPTEMPRVRRVLSTLTLMAIDHPDAMDAVLSRWLQACPEQDTILAVAEKMGWDTGASPLFREAMAAHEAQMAAVQAELEERQTEPPQEASEAEEEAEPPEDDGFQAVELTKPRG